MSRAYSRASRSHSGQFIKLTLGVNYYDRTAGKMQGCSLGKVLPRESAAHRRIPTTPGCASSWIACIMPRISSQWKPFDRRNSDGFDRMPAGAKIGPLQPSMRSDVPISQVDSEDSDDSTLEHFCGLDRR